MHGFHAGDLIESSAVGTIIVPILQIRELPREVLHPVSGQAVHSGIYRVGAGIWPVVVASSVGLSFACP